MHLRINHRLKQAILRLAIALLAVHWPGMAATQFAGGTYVSTTFVGSTKQNIINNVEDNLVTAGWTSVAGLFSGTYTSGGSITGSAGQTCLLSSFNNGNTGGTATVTLTGTNTIAGGTALTITAIGTGSTSAATSATFTSGTATCSGTPTISTVISKTHSTNTLLQSALAQSAYQINIRLMDNGGTCVQVYLENTAFTLKPSSYTTGKGAQLNPTGSPTYSIQATRYQALVYTTASTTSRNFAWFGMPYIQSFATGSITNVGFVFGDAIGDTDTTVRAHLRYAPTIASNQNNAAPNWEVMLNANWWENTANQNNHTNSFAGAPRLMLTGITGDMNMLISTPNTYRWFGPSAIITGDVYVAWGASSLSTEAQIMGQLYDAIYIADNVTINTTSTFASHNWINITDNFVGTLGILPRGGVWFATN